MLKKSIIALSGTFFVAFLNYLFHIITSRNLVIADYGDMALLISFMMIITFPFGAIITTLSRKIAKLDHEGKNEEILGLVKHYFKKLTLFGILLFFIAILSLAVASLFFKNSRVIFGLQIVSISVLTGSFTSILKGYLQGKEAILKLIVINAAEPIIKLLMISLLVIKLGWGFSGIVISLIVSGIIFSVTLVPMLSKKTMTIMSTNHFIDFGVVPIFLTNLSISLILYLDIFFVKLFAGSENAGYYNIAGITSKLIYFAAGGIALVLLPISSKLNIKVDKKKIIILLSKGIGILSLGLIFALLISKWFIPFFFSDRYIVSVKPFMFLVVGMYFLGVNTLIFNVLWSQHFEKKTAFSAIFALLLQIILLSVLVPNFKIIGAAIATTSSCAALLMMSLIHLFRCTKEFEIKSQ